MHTCRNAYSVAAVGTLVHSMHLPHSVAATYASLAALIGAICLSTSVTVCIPDRILVCSHTRVWRGRDHGHVRQPS